MILGRLTSQGLYAYVQTGAVDEIAYMQIWCDSFLPKYPYTTEKTHTIGPPKSENPTQVTLIKITTFTLNELINYYLADNDKESETTDDVAVTWCHIWL